LRHDADDDVEGFEGVSAGDLDPSHEQECSAPAVKLAERSSNRAQLSTVAPAACVSGIRISTPNRRDGRSDRSPMGCRRRAVAILGRSGGCERP